MGTTRMSPLVKQILPILAWEMRKRGTDAWGAVNSNEEVIKNLGSITKSWGGFESWSDGIFHTRAATHGSPNEINNAHPFSFDKSNGEGKIIGIHNGVVRSHTELNRDFDRDFEVDSMHIYKHIADELQMTDIKGYGNLAWFDNKELRFARFNSFDLHVFTLWSGELVFCSLAGPVEDSIAMFGGAIKTKWKIEDDMQYGVATNAEGLDVLIELGPMQFGDNGWARTPNRAYTPIVTPHSDSTVDGGSTRYSPFPPPTIGKDCYLCRKVSIGGEDVVCGKCLSMEIRIWKQLQLEEQE